MSRLQMRIDLTDEMTEQLDAMASATGTTTTKLASFLLGQALFAQQRGWLSQNVTSSGTECDKPAVQAAPTPQVEPVVQLIDAPVAPRGPHFGALPHDTDEILSLLETLNAMPESRATEPELMLLNATRRADVLRQIGKLRRLDAERRQNTPS